MTGTRTSRPAFTVLIAGLAIGMIAWVGVTAWRVSVAQPQYKPSDGLYPGSVAVEINVSASSSIPASTPSGSTGGGGPASKFGPVPAIVELLRYGDENHLYYDRLTIKTTGARPPFSAPPPGWGPAAAADASIASSKELTALGLARYPVDWLAVGRGETWSRTFINWSEIWMLALRCAPAALIAACVAAAFAPVARSKFRSLRRTKRGRCIHCGYDVGVSNTERCPECGQRK